MHGPTRFALFFALVLLVINSGCSCSDGDSDASDDDVSDDVIIDDDSADDDETPDDDSADDDSIDDDTTDWPDDVEPVVGWVATGESVPPWEVVWGGLYQIRANDYVEVEPPGDHPFTDGSLPSKDVGWALNYKAGTNELYRLESGTWTLMDPQPPCPAYGSVHPEMQGVRAFADGTGYVVCQGAYLLAWDGSEWTTHELPAYEPGHWIYGVGIDCLSWDECILWNDQGIYWWDGSEFTTEEAECTSQVLLQDSELAYRLMIDGCLYEGVHLEVRREGTWEIEETFVPDYMGTALMSRVDAHHTAFVYQTQDGIFDVVVRDGETVQSQSWPSLWWMSFGQGGGGLGESPVTRGIYRITGTQAELMFSYEPDTSYPYCILAADAE